MRFRRKQKITSRRARPSAGHSLSTNSYYRPTSRPVQDLHGIDKAKESKQKDSKQADSTRVFRLRPTYISNVLLLALFLVLLFFATTLSSTPNVLIPEGSYSYHNASDYEASAADILNDSLLQRSKLFFRSFDFESSLLQQYPELSNVEAIVPLGGRDLTVALTVSEPLAKVQSGEEKGVLDTNGVLVVADEQDTHQLYTVRFTTPQGNFFIGSRVLTEDEVQLLSLLESELATLQLKDINSVTIKEVLFNVADGVFEVHMNELPYFIKISSYADAAEQVGAVKVSLEELHKQNQAPKKYLDARVPGRVYVQ